MTSTSDRVGNPPSKPTPRELKIETLELRVALGGKSAGAAQAELEALLDESETSE